MLFKLTAKKSTTIGYIIDDKDRVTKVTTRGDMTNCKKIVIDSDSVEEALSNREGLCLILFRHGVTQIIDPELTNKTKCGPTFGLWEWSNFYTI